MRRPPKFSKLIPRKIIEIVATLKLNALNSISAGAPPQTPLGKLTALPRPLAGFTGPTFKGGEEGREGREKEREKGL